MTFNHRRDNTDATGSKAKVAEDVLWTDLYTRQKPEPSEAPRTTTYGAGCLCPSSLSVKWERLVREEIEEMRAEVVAVFFRPLMM